MSIIVKRYTSDLLLSNMYIVSDNGHAIVIDPNNNTDLADGLRIDWILLTHEHYDHISGVNSWKEVSQAPVLCSAKCFEMISDPRKSLARHFSVFCELQSWIELDEIPEADENYVCNADVTFEDLVELEWEGHKIILFEMPGHSPGSIGILIDEEYFFSGDSLMRDYDIELRFPGGSRKQWESVGKKRLYEVPRNAKVFPGHFDEFYLNEKPGWF